MSANPIEWRDVVTGQIRAVRAAHPHADELLTNWGAWSRNKSGIHAAGVVQPPIFRNIPPGEPEGWGLPGIEESVRDLLQRDSANAKAESGTRLPYNEREAIQTDMALCDPTPAIYRVIARWTYVYSVPEYQLPERCKCRDSFCQLFDGLLVHLTPG